MPKCVICASCHKIEDHQYDITNSNIQKIGAHVVVKWANCGGSNPANSNWCTSRQKTKANIHKKKKPNKNKAKMVKTTGSNKNVYDKANSSLDMRIDLKTKDWVKSWKIKGISSQRTIKERNYMQDHLMLIIK